MSGTTFNEDELTAFKRRFAQTPGWRDWHRGQGADGREILEVIIDGDPQVTLKIARTASNRYLATGFAGWGLTVCDDFAELLAILAAYRPRPREVGPPVRIRAA